MKQSLKVLQVTAADVTVKKLLMPLIDRLNSEGYQVHIACSNGDCISELRARGYAVHTIEIERRISPVSNLKSLWRLYRLMKSERFDIVHVHTPVAAALGRVAAWAARVPVIIYTAHGFYFHDNMPAWLRRAAIWMEKFLCYFTHLVFTQSNEDAVTAVKEGICSENKVICIGNGVDIERFTYHPEPNGARAPLGLAAPDKVIGFVGRMVAEKGIVELVEAMKKVIKVLPEAKLLLVGDTLLSDRDRDTKLVIKNMLAQDDLASHVIFTGFIEDIPGVMKAIDLFTLPSYREGMPRSLIEAMASGKPVVATNIRGCREEVVPGSTGLLVPVKDSAALAKAIVSVLSDPELALRMGVEGRRRACELFDERIILDKQVKAYTEIIRRRQEHLSSSEKTMACKKVQLALKRAADITISFVSLTILAIPFLAIAALIKMDSKGSVFFRQERVSKGGKSFLIWKFRTMENNAVNHGLGLNVASNDSRITRIGKLLRFGLDELPQIINVLSGEMSLVGPRPTLRYQVDKYGDFERQRLLAKPGITSLAVVSGRNLLSWNERIKLDVEYVTDWSLWLDVKIIIKTFWAVLVTRKGIYGADGVNDDFLSKSAATRE
jgi:lipopolysaccharide/colanic/teichoic acid biosynthesis glycosyltransferase/glycosyltransferase involved in cell wall biosynthesis